METHESHALDGLYGYIGETVAAKARKHGLDDATVRRMADAGLFEKRNFRMTLRLLENMMSVLGLERTTDVINAEPLNMLRPIKRLGSHIRDLVTELAIRRGDALQVLTKKFEVLELTEADFNSKCRAIASMIPDSGRRREFILAYPECLMIPYVHLLRRQGMRFTERSPDQIWDVLTNDGDKQVEMEPYEPRNRKKKKTRQSSQPANNDPETQSTEQPPPNSDSWPEQEEDLPEHMEEKIVENGKLREYEESGEADLPVRAPFPTAGAITTAIELTDTNGMYVLNVIRFLTTDKGAGVHWDIARPLVAHRQWLADPGLNNLRTLEILSALGIRGGLMLDALRHDGLFALGYYELEPMLTELTENSSLPFPDDIRDIAIPRRIILRRLKALEEKKIAPSDPRFKPALYAPTEREFKKRLPS